MTPRVLLVEDHALLAQSVGLALRLEGIEVEFAELTDVATMVSRVRDRPPDVILLDLELGGDIPDGTELVHPFTRAGSRVVVVSAVTDRCRLAAAVEQGAVGLVPKFAPFEMLLDDVLAVTRGEQILADDERQRLMRELRASRETEQAHRERFERLTPREQQVLRALADGRSVASIAAEWVVAEATVRTQVRGVLMKLGVSSQLEAVACATKSGWLRPTG